MVPYPEIRNHIKSCALVEFAGRTPLAHAIRWVTGQKVNHSAVAVWNRPCMSHRLDQRIDTLDNRLYVLEAISNGCRPTLLSEKLREFSGEVYVSNIRDCYTSSRQRFLIELHKLEGTAYDYRSLVGNLFRRVPLDFDKLYCSEWIHAGLVKSHLLPVHYSPTGKDKHAGTGIRPGEFGLAKIFSTEYRIK